MLVSRDRYTEQQDRISQAFHYSGASCVCRCDCGIVHFVTADGHGDYDEGELEELLKKEEADPDKYVNWDVFNSIETFLFEEREYVIGCPCKNDIRVAEAIERNSERFVEYLSLLYVHKIKRDSMKLSRSSYCEALMHFCKEANWAKEEFKKIVKELNSENQAPF